MTPQTSFIHGITVRLNGIRPLLMLKAYFDESGHPSDQRVLAVGGCLASLSAWEALEQRWKKALNDAGIPFFRMSKFEAGEDHFRNWTKKERETFLASLLNIMNEHIDFYIGGCLLARDESRSLREEFRQSPRAVPYFHCFFHSITAAEHISADRYMDETTQLVFAEQEEFGEQAMQWYSKSKRTFPECYTHIESAAFAPYIKTVQLHTADLVAYTLTRRLKNDLDRIVRPYYPWKRLHEKPCHFMGWGSTVDWESPPRFSQEKG